MSIKKKKTILLFFITFFFTSCIVKDGQSHLNATTSPIISRTASATATATVTPIPPSPTLTSLPIISTLSNEDAYSLLFDMLHAGGRCELPCWLNITPSMSSHSDAHKEWGAFLTEADTTEPFPKDYL